ncbi:hypothetical protein G3567_13150 [Psychroflexus sp. YR1-1]|uniref:Uncharacterized protein n=1 Tax=Psychroflexus aurantiacus TaxID=2709310 RepID=A0A6B3R3V8_9FLAO|nr:hypothetical protein [Psychroflexus aurantiacus]NEV95083.1 hypothetical protein [Psychroflexus aurantiacus]
MTEFIIISILVILFVGFLYWAYLPDYRRNPKEFWRTIIGMPIGMLLGGLGYSTLNEKIKKWATDDKKKNTK